MAQQSAPTRPSYLKAAFWNVYNVTSLAGVGVAALFTGEPWLLGMGLAAEALWLLFVPDNKRFQRAINARFQNERILERLRAVQAQAQFLPAPQRDKVQALLVRAAEVKQECQKNPQLEGEFMTAQLEKLDGLVAEYVHLAVIGRRCAAYLDTTDARSLNRERDKWQRNLDTATDAAARSIAEQNKAVLEKRLAIIHQLGMFTERASGQMSLIENTISLLRDQVMTMATPETLGGQLDELMTSVEAIGESMRDAEAVVSGHVPLGELVPPPTESEAAETPRAVRMRG